MTVTHSKRIVASTLPSHCISFILLSNELKEYLTENNMVQSYYKMRDDTNGNFYLYLTNNGRLDINYK